MKQFIEPEMELLELDILDILTASLELNDVAADDLVGWDIYK